MAIEQKLILERTFHHSAHYIYQVFTQADYMQVWWSADTEITSDPVVGGEWRIARPYEGEWFVSHGAYKELIQDQKIVYTSKMPMFSDNEDLITITITPLAHELTQITLIQEGKDIAAELEALEQGDVSESEQGWLIAFEMIDKAL